MKSDRAVVVSHLVPQILRKGDAEFVAVLRCSPDELEKRLQRRGYSKKKIKENVLSEILDICLYDVLRKFGSDKVGEFDTTGRNPTLVAKSIIAAYRNESKPKVGIVDWLKVVAESGTLSLYT